MLILYAARNIILRFKMEYLISAGVLRRKCSVETNAMFDAFNNRPADEQRKAEREESDNVVSDKLSV